MRLIESDAMIWGLKAMLKKRDIIFQYYFLIKHFLLAFKKYCLFDTRCSNKIKLDDALTK